MRNSFAPSRLFRVFSDCQQYFFGRESLFCPFFHFYTGKICFSRQYYLGVFGFLRVFFFLGHFFCFITRKNRELSTVYFFFHGIFLSQPRLLLFLPILVLKKNTQLVFFERGQGGGRLPIPSINTAILLTCFLILKVNMHSVLSPGTLPRPVREIGLLEAK